MYHHYIDWNNLPKFHENHASSFWAVLKYVCNCGVTKVTTLGYKKITNGRGGGDARGLSVQKNKKIIRTEPLLKSNSTWFSLKISHIWGGQRGSIIHSEKWENHKNSTHTKNKFYIIFIIFFSFLIDIKMFTYGRTRGPRGRQGALSDQKNEKITRTVPILKSNSA